MVQFLSINFFSWISLIFVVFFKSSHFFSPCTSKQCVGELAVYSFPKIHLKFITTSTFLPSHLAVLKRDPKKKCFLFPHTSYVFITIQ